DPHAAPTTAVARFDEHRPTDLVGRLLDGLVVHAGEVDAGQYGHAGVLHDLARTDLRTHLLDGFGRRADEDQPRVRARLCEARVLGEEAVARVHGVGTGTLGRVDDGVHAQVRLRRRGASDRHRDVGVAHERFVGVGIGIYGDGGDPEV